MSWMRRVGPAVVLCLLAGVLLYVGWQTVAGPGDSECGVCGRAVHLGSRVDALVDGELTTFCCAACAVRGDAEDFVRVYDYATGVAMEPDRAFVVVGSEVNLCMRDHVLMDSREGASDLHYDRCSPSALAFATKEAAEVFAVEHGGRVLAVAELPDAFQ